MKGFIDENGYDRPACVTCKHKNRMTVESPCYNCVSIMDLVLSKPNCETEFAAYEPKEELTDD